MSLTSSDIECVRDVLRRYDKAVEVADARAVADLFTSYGAYLPDGDRPAFGSDIQQRYQSIFDSGWRFVGHELYEVAAVDSLTFAVAVTRPLQPDVKEVGCDRNLFVLNNIEGQWKIVAFAPGALTSGPGC